MGQRWPEGGKSIDSSALAQVGAVLDELTVYVRQLASQEPEKVRDFGAAVDELKIVEQLIRQRVERIKFFPEDWFSDPAWDILLFLFRCQLRREAITVGDVGHGTDIRASTTIRWLDIIGAAGLVDRKRCDDDARRVFISLTERGVDAMRQYIAAAAE